MLQAKNAFDRPRKITTFAESLRGDDAKTLRYLMEFGAFIYGSELVNEYVYPFKASIRKYWNKLKGFNVDVESYKYPDLTFDDPRLIGLESQISEMEDYVTYLTQPETFDMNKTTPPKCVLFEGPSRSGKTYLANAFCGTLRRGSGDAHPGDFAAHGH